MANAVELREQALAKLNEAKAFAEAKGVGDGELTPEDQATFDGLMAEFRETDSKAQKAAANGDSIGTLQQRLEWYTAKATGQPATFQSVQIPAGAGQSRGALFTASKEYRELVESGALVSDRASFKSSPFQAAASDVVNSTSGSGGAALVTPQYLPSVSDLPQRPLTIRDLFSSGTATSDSISYAQQSAFDNAAATVAQATAANNGAKPQSSIAWTRKTAAVETIATWMAVTRQQLADAGQVRAIIDNQLELMLRLEEEDQLLNGNGTSPNISGIYDQTGVQTLDLTAATSNGDPNLDGIRNAKRLVKVGVSRADADFVVLNPSDSMEFDLLVDNEGRYRIGDPFGQAAGAGPRPIWGLRRVESEAVAEGSALVGAGKIGATVLERQGVTILTADQHSDFFVRNLVVVLAEERLGFPVFFPSAFVDVTLAAWTAAS
jgi:HK97 family phage major capsid protein